MSLSRPTPPLPKRHAAAARHRAAAVALALAAAAALTAGSAATEPPATAAGSCRIAALHVIPAVPLAAAADHSRGGPAAAGRRRRVMLGGVSDLASLHVTADAPGSVPPASGTIELWAITDRGPNGSVETPAGKRRTLLDRDFVPSIIRIDLRIDTDPGVPSTSSPVAPAAASVGLVLPLADASGQPLSGRPNGVGRDEPILDHGDGSPIAPDPDGIDPEGLLRLRDGSFWVAEEYRPSLLRVSADGRGLVRYVPAGTSIPAAGMEIRGRLPADYAGRRDNRGFESLAMSPDESLLWLLLQSPLEQPSPEDGAATGNVRLLAFDTKAGRPAAEHVYRLGDPSSPGFLTRGAPPQDGKLCAIATISETALLVLEQAEGGVARLYECTLPGATDTLRRASAEESVAIEAIRDLPAAGIVPVAKRLVTDLSPLLGAMSRHVHGDAPAPPSLKLEGIAILGPRHVAIVNDDDFGLSASNSAKEGNGPRYPRTCLWVVELGRPLWASSADVPRPRQSDRNRDAALTTTP